MAEKPIRDVYVFMNMSPLYDRVFLFVAVHSFNKPITALHNLSNTHREFIGSL